MFVIRKEYTSPAMSTFMCYQAKDRVIVIDNHINYDDFKILIKECYSYLFDLKVRNKIRRSTIYMKDLIEIKDKDIEEKSNFINKHCITSKMFRKLIIKYVDKNYKHTHIPRHIGDTNEIPDDFREDWHKLNKKELKYKYPNSHKLSSLLCNELRGSDLPDLIYKNWENKELKIDDFCEKHKIARDFYNRELFKKKHNK